MRGSALKDETSAKSISACDLTNPSLTDLPNASSGHFANDTSCLWGPSPISFRQGLLVKVDNQLVGTEEVSKSLRCSLCPETRVGRFSFDCNPGLFSS